MAVLLESDGAVTEPSTGLSSDVSLTSHRAAVPKSGKGPESAPGQAGADSESSMQSSATNVAASSDQTSPRLKIGPDDIPQPANGTAVFTINEIVAHAVAAHPGVASAAGQIEIARADFVTAAGKENPNFVVDIETPVYESNDATEVSTRLIFPIRHPRVRHFRKRVARAAINKATAEADAISRQVERDASVAALTTLYLQQAVDIDRRRERVAVQQAAAVAPDRTTGDPAANLARHVDAQLDADEARLRRFESERQLAVAQAALINAMGVPEPIEANLPGFASTIWVSGNLHRVSLDLPTRADVLVSAEENSRAIAVAAAALGEANEELSLQRVIRPEAKVGPLYQDRLGRDDDSIGFRLDADLPLHDTQDGPIRSAAATENRQREELRRARHEASGLAMKSFRELEALAPQIQQFRENRFSVTDDQALNDPVAQQLLTAMQLLKLEQAALRRRRERLTLEYRFALLKSQLSLSPRLDELEASDTQADQSIDE